MHMPITLILHILTVNRPALHKSYTIPIRGRSRNFWWGAQSLFKKKSSGALVPTHCKVPCLYKIRGGHTLVSATVQRFSRAGPRGRAREWATLGVHSLSWLISNNRLEEVCGTLTKVTFSSRLLLSNQDKGCTPSVAHSLPLPPGFCSTCLIRGCIGGTSPP